MKKRLICNAIVCCALFCLFPDIVEAVSKDVPYGGADINAHADKISSLLFGPIAKVAAVFGGGIGILVGLVQQSVTKIMTFGGLALATAALPTFINNVFTILLQ